MKKTIVITAIALGLTVGAINAKPMTSNFEGEKTEKVAVIKVNAFCVSIAKGDTEIVKKLIALGENVNKKSNGMTPLMYAAKFNRVEILELLIANGAKLKIKTENGYTAMKYAELSKANDAIDALNNALSKKS